MSGVSFPFVLKQYAVVELGKPLQPFETTVEALEPFEILLEVHFCSICRSDYHLWVGDWGPMTQVPQVLGHEIVGKVIAVGSAVKNHAVGSRVAVGWQAGSCMSCGYCMDGEQHLCNSSVGTPLGRRGGFAHHSVVDARFALPVPENLKSHEVAPMMCGGCTVFSPLIANARPGDRVGVIGIGGLGSMALQFARAIGCEAVAFTSSPGKVDEIKNTLGAHRVIVTSDEESMKQAAGSLDLLINTIDVEMDVVKYMQTLSKKGKFCTLGAIPKVEFKGHDVASTFVFSAKCVLGSLIASPSVIDRMLHVASYNNVHPIVEIFPHTKINEAMQHTATGKARFRSVVQFKEGADL